MSALVGHTSFVERMCPSSAPGSILYLYYRIYGPRGQDMVSERPTTALLRLLARTRVVTLQNINNARLHKEEIDVPI